MAWKQGLYEVKNRNKYDGDYTNVVYRSSWELDAFEFCDNNPNVLKWSSEEIVIPYAVPANNGGIRPAKYYPDLYMECKISDGRIIKYLIEIKPAKQTKPSKSRNTRNKMYENSVYQKNQLKWKAAELWCQERNIQFKLLTENDQFK